MEMSARARSLIDEFARQQGLPRLDFDADGLIGIRLDGSLEVAVGYSSANDALFLTGVVDPAPDAETLDVWGLFTRNASLAPRRTRLAIDPASSALILVCDLYVEGLEYHGFAAALNMFVRDLDGAGDPRRAETMAEEDLPREDMMVFRL